MQFVSQKNNFPIKRGNILVYTLQQFISRSKTRIWLHTFPEAPAWNYPRKRKTSPPLRANRNRERRALPPLPPLDSLEPYVNSPRFGGSARLPSWTPSQTSETIVFYDLILLSTISDTRNNCFLWFDIAEHHLRYLKQSFSMIWHCWTPSQTSETIIFHDLTLLNTISDIRAIVFYDLTLLNTISDIQNNRFLWFDIVEHHLRQPRQLCSIIWHCWTSSQTSKTIVFYDLTLLNTISDIRNNCFLWFDIIDHHLRHPKQSFSMIWHCWTPSQTSETIVFYDLTLLNIILDIRNNRFLWFDIVEHHL